MDKEKLKEKVAEAGNWIKDKTIEAFVEARNSHEDDLFNKGYNLGRNNQWEEDINATIRAFLELKIKEQDIFRLLSEYFDVDSISTATALLLDAKKTRQIKALRQYCEKIGMNSIEFKRYLREHDIAERLLENERLLDCSPEKLKDFFDKN